MLNKAVIPDPSKKPPTIFFEDSLVAGITPMCRNAPFDEVIDRPYGMKGYIINLTLKGRGLIHDGNLDFECQRGDLLLFPPGVPHYYHRSESSDEWYHAWVYFFAQDNWINYLNWNSKVNSVEKVTLKEDVVEEFSQYFVEIIKRQHTSDEISKRLAINFLETILLRRIEAATTSLSNILDSRVSMALLYMKDNLHRSDLNIEEIAKSVHLSSSRLSHLFVSELNKSPIRWLNEQRLMRAKNLLVTSYLGVEEIAEQVGFADATYFYRAFKKEFSMTPLQYKKHQLTTA